MEEELKQNDEYLPPGIVTGNVIRSYEPDYMLLDEGSLTINNVLNNNKLVFH